MKTQADVQVHCNLQVENSAEYDVSLAGLSIPISFDKLLKSGEVGGSDDFVAICNYLYTSGRPKFPIMFSEYLFECDAKPKSQSVVNNYRRSSFSTNKI